jgi:glycosyltransferase involved in cell wall biosynthesis/peptidoglycan/xylan/chitin deacetylase (PgdA/CDA1 family)
VSGGHVRVCVIAYTYYETDSRVRRYAEALAKRGDQVDVVALGNGVAYRKRDSLRGVNVYRIQKRAISEKYQLSYLMKIVVFLFRSGAFVTRRHLKEPYDLFHIHSVPDFEVFSALIPRLMSAKVILDIHDIVPEFYASKFGASKDSLVFKALVLVEKLSIAFSHHVIIANHIWEKRLSRSVCQEKCSVYLNYPDPALFYPRETTKNDKKLVFMYPGTLSWHQGLDIALRAFALAKTELPSAEFHIVGNGHEKNELMNLARSLEIEDKVIFRDFVPIEEVIDLMASAHVGVVPKRNDSFGGEAFSTKIFEFMALGIPVIASATRIDSFYFSESVLEFFEPENERDLASTMVRLAKHEEHRHALAQTALRFMTQYSWDTKEQEYLDLADRLVRKERTPKSEASLLRRLSLMMYYLLKPAVPRTLQIRVRRTMALHKRRACAGIWPIDQRAATKPAGWRGWPGGKRFALVLTHDVEGMRGQERCLQVAELERRLGFRSSFNFVAEEYEVSQDILNKLRRTGSEIGVHGLTHRRNPFRSRKVFDRHIPKINHYLDEWSAVGFRCPSMYHNLKWIGDLNIMYDASTFDVDPFEPQPDGVGTIYPFVVSNCGSRNYVELPYTLPQDHLVYVIMREQAISIWKAKLDWIAQNGGMALLITHPDYMAFDDRQMSVDEYPVRFYREFLEYVRDTYEGEYWHGLPRDVAQFALDAETDTMAHASVEG